MELDHLVINTLRGMEDAARIFTALGFALTPRGYHSLGSVNHLAVVPGAYLELVGLPETGKQRQEVLDSPLGLSGLVFKTDDPDALFARLTAQGLAVAEPIAFSRPVELADETRHARFRTVRLAPSVFPAGRVYFCQHFTPELVWRPEDMTHPNGFRAMSRLVADSPDPEAEATLYARVLGIEVERADAGWLLELGAFALELRQGPRHRFARAVLDFDDCTTLAARATVTQGVNWAGTAAGGTLSIAALDLDLVCRTAR